MHFQSGKRETLVYNDRLYTLHHGDANCVDTQTIIAVISVERVDAQIIRLLRRRCCGACQRDQTTGVSHVHV